MPIAIAVHGGAGTLLPEEMIASQDQEFRDGLIKAVQAGWEILKAGGSSLDAVEESVRHLEDNPNFNAGRGAVFNSGGFHEMDAAIMYGFNQNAGAVAGIRDVKNPVHLARKILEQGHHVLLSGAGAQLFAQSQGLECMPDSYFHDDLRFEQWKKAQKENLIMLDQSYAYKMGTVGAVALDSNGHLSAATSTGGMTNKHIGRVGDSPLIGCGTYANEKLAVSCTGHGELFIRAVAAYDLACLVAYKGMSLSDAANYLVNKKLKQFGAEGGLIALDEAGNLALPFNSVGMYRASIDAKGRLETGIFEK
jgi:L-asparaginase / beta-aspartyl-peptidase